MKSKKPKEEEQALEGRISIKRGVSKKTTVANRHTANQMK